MQCEEKIRDKLGHQFDESWEQLCMKRKIAVLEYLKRRAKDKDVSQWRPYNKTPADQCRPYIMDILNGKNYYMNQYLQEQQKKLVMVSYEMIRLIHRTLTIHDTPCRTSYQLWMNID